MNSINRNEVKNFYLGNFKLDDVREFNLPSKLTVGLEIPDPTSEDVTYRISRIEGKTVYISLV